MRNNDSNTTTPTTSRRSRSRRIGSAAMVVAALFGAGSSVLPSTAFAADPSETGQVEIAAPAHDVAPLTHEEMQALRVELQAMSAELEASGGFRATTTSWSSLATALGTRLGEKVFGNVLDYGLDALMDELGLGDGTGQALEDIKSSIDNVQASVDKNTALLKDLMITASWDKFDLAETDVQAAAGLISDATKNISEFEKQGKVPSGDDVKKIWESTEGAISTIHSRTAGDVGTMAFLQEAVTSEDPEAAWTTIELYRAHYRGVLAQGLVNLTWLMRYDELTTLTLPVYYETSVDNAGNTIAASYDGVGVAYQDPIEFTPTPSTAGSAIY